MESVTGTGSHAWPELPEEALSDLGGADGGAQAVDGYCVCLRLLVDLEKQRGLFEGVQSFLGPAVHQVPVDQPVLQLPAAVPKSRKSRRVSTTRGDSGSHRGRLC